MLDDRGIPYTRIDGKTSLARRAEALQNFHKDGTLRVILVSITCGGAGSATPPTHSFPLQKATLTPNSLDLTAASRVYLMEPHWNPMIEEQALCRVHRVGQKRNVTTVRYLMRDSFEEVNHTRSSRERTIWLIRTTASRRDPKTKETTRKSSVWPRSAARSWDWTWDFAGM